MKSIYGIFVKQPSSYSYSDVASQSIWHTQYFNMKWAWAFTKELWFPVLWRRSHNKSESILAPLSNCIRLFQPLGFRSIQWCQEIDTGENQYFTSIPDESLERLEKSHDSQVLTISWNILWKILFDKNIQLRLMDEIENNKIDFSASSGQKEYVQESSFCISLLERYLCAGHYLFVLVHI